MISTHNGFKLQINNKMSRKSPNMWKLNSIHLKKPWSKKKKNYTEIIKYFYDNENIAY